MTYVDWHRGIRKAYPDALLNISGETFDDLIVVNQETGKPFQFDQSAAELAYVDLVAEDNFKALRTRRNQLLTETDWVTLKATDDSNDGLGIQLPQVWMDYRQALRDLPANTVDPANPVWPTKPGGN